MLQRQCRNVAPLAVALCLTLFACGGARIAGTPYAPNEAQPAASIQTGVIAHVGEATIGQRAAALHLTIDLDNGQAIQLVQLEDDIYMPGDRVRIVYDKAGKARAQQYSHSQANAL